MAVNKILKSIDLAHNSDFKKVFNKNEKDLKQWKDDSGRNLYFYIFSKGIDYVFDENHNLAIQRHHCDYHKERNSEFLLDMFIFLLNKKVNFVHKDIHNQDNLFYLINNPNNDHIILDAIYILLHNNIVSIDDVTKALEKTFKNKSLLNIYPKKENRLNKIRMLLKKLHPELFHNYYLTRNDLNKGYTHCVKLGYLHSLELL